MENKERKKINGKKERVKRRKEREEGGVP